ncbi:hypothetical protein WR25_14920 [Diploscapter pachys]|uniref:Uncharacterized protein n=1 Tax=Diploscapter pachys TaxID=2018661 RepID=A0A2A2LJP9_9BILA|nr:hypothetical protein WR25_14920 [Diploscapter pachys]
MEDVVLILKPKIDSVFLESAPLTNLSIPLSIAQQAILAFQNHKKWWPNKLVEKTEESRAFNSENHMK